MCARTEFLAHEEGFVEKVLRKIGALRKITQIVHKLAHFSIADRTCDAKRLYRFTQ
jgi:hypothetical protein